MSLPLFLYGTLLDRRVLVRRLRPALLPGWHRVALRGTPYPTLLRTAGAETRGALLRVGPAALARAWITQRRHADAARDWVLRG